MILAGGNDNVVSLSDYVATPASQEKPQDKQEAEP